MTTATPTRRRTRELVVTIGNDEDVPTVGDIVCVVEETDTIWAARTPGARGRRRVTHAVTKRPQTNMSHEERWEGWLGTTNDIDRYAEGSYRVTWIAEDDRGLPWHRVSLRPVAHPGSH